MLEREAPVLEYSARDPRVNTQHVFLAVDPSGGGASAFSIATICCGPNGFMHARKRKLKPQLLNLRVLFQPHAHRLPGPQFTERAHQRNECVGLLAHPRYKTGNGHGQNARLQVGH